MILVPLSFLGCHLCQAYCSSSAFFSSCNIIKIKSSFKLTSTQFRHGGLQKLISWWILNHVQWTITRGVSACFNTFRNVCTCTKALRVDVLVNYRHAEFHHLTFDIYICASWWDSLIKINIDPDPNPTKIKRNIWLSSSVPCYGPGEQALV